MSKVDTSLKHRRRIKRAATLHEKTQSPRGGGMMIKLKDQMCECGHLYVNHTKVYYDFNKGRPCHQCKCERFVYSPKKTRRRADVMAELVAALEESED